MTNLKKTNNIDDKNKKKVISTSLNSKSKIVISSKSKEQEEINKEIIKDQEIKKKEIRKQKILWRKFSSKKNRVRSEFKFKIVDVKRITKVTKGGRRFRFMVIALAGDGKGRVGVGYGKSHEVGIARSKAFAKAEKNVFFVPFTKTIPHEISTKFCSSKILLKPAAEGTGIVLGGSARIVIEMLGIKNIRGKALSSTNKMNLVQATIKALKLLRTREQIMELRSNDE